MGFNAQTSANIGSTGEQCHRGQSSMRRRKRSASVCSPLTSTLARLPTGMSASATRWSVETRAWHSSQTVPSSVTVRTSQRRTTAARPSRRRVKRSTTRAVWWQSAIAARRRTRTRSRRGKYGTIEGGLQHANEVFGGTGLGVNPLLLSLPLPWQGARKGNVTGLRVANTRSFYIFDKKYIIYIIHLSQPEKTSDKDGRISIEMRWEVLVYLLFFFSFVSGFPWVSCFVVGIIVGDTVRRNVRVIVL